MAKIICPWTYILMWNPNYYMRNSTRCFFHMFLFLNSTDCASQKINVKFLSENISGKKYIINLNFSMPSVAYYIQKICIDIKHIIRMLRTISRVITLKFVYIFLYCLYFHTLLLAK